MYNVVRGIITDLMNYGDNNVIGIKIEEKLNNYAFRRG